jgi:hypothetical protein
VTLQHAHVISILRCVVAIDEGSFRLGILSRVPPLSLFDMLIKTRGHSGLDIPFVVRPLRWSFHLLGHGSFHFVPCIPPFVSALVYL